MTDREGVTVEIIRCAMCARLGVAIGGTRITAHKCAGKWHVEREELVARGTIADALESTRADTEGKADG